MKYSSFAIALLLNLTFADALHLHTIVDKADAKKTDSKKDAAKNATKKDTLPYAEYKTESQIKKELDDIAAELKKEKIRKYKEATKDFYELPKPGPIDYNPITEALQAGDELDRQQKKEAADKLAKISMRSKVLPVEPAKIWEIVESKPLEPKVEKPEPEAVKDADDEKCKFRGNVDEKFEALLEAYKKASDVVELEGYKNKWK
jgi:hypothetical protein